MIKSWRNRANTKTIILACETCSEPIGENSAFEDEQIPFLLLNTEIEEVTSHMRYETIVNRQSSSRIQFYYCRIRVQKEEWRVFRAITNVAEKI